MSQKGPPSSFLIFCERMYVNKSQGRPFYIFQHYVTFSERKKIEVFSKKIFPVGEKVSESYGAWKAPFGCLETLFELFINMPWAYIYTCDKQVLCESAGAFCLGSPAWDFSERQKADELTTLNFPHLYSFVCQTI